jgi:hypothetical protein
LKLPLTDSDELEGEVFAAIVHITFKLKLDVANGTHEVPGVMKTFLEEQETGSLAKSCFKAFDLIL